MKERGENMQPGTNFDDGIKTVNFNKDPHTENIDVHYHEPELIAQDQWQANWSGKRNIDKFAKVNDRVYEKRHRENYNSMVHSYKSIAN